MPDCYPSKMILNFLIVLSKMIKSKKMTIES